MIRCPYLPTALELLPEYSVKTIPAVCGHSIKISAYYLTDMGYLLSLFKCPCVVINYNCNYTWTSIINATY